MIWDWVGRTGVLLCIMAIVGAMGWWYGALLLLGIIMMLVSLTRVRDGLKR